MASDPLSDNDSQDAAWDEISRLVDEVADLADTDASPPQFYDTLLARAVQAMAAVGGAVWLRSENQWRQVAALDPPRDFPLAVHTELLHALSDQAAPRILAPHSQAPDGLCNPTQQLLVTAPIGPPHACLGIIEIFQRSTLHPAAQRGNLRLLEMLREIAGDYHRRRELTVLRDREAEREALTDFSLAIHQCMGLQATAFSIANEARRVLHCDRVSVIHGQGSRAKVIAVSGVDTIDLRANAVQKLTQVAAMVRHTHEPIWYDANTSQTSPEVAELLQSYADEQHLRALAIVPLTERANESSDPVAALVIESLTADAVDPESTSLQHVCRHSAIAIQRAATLENIPGWRTLQWLATTAGYLFVTRLPRTALLLSLLVGLVAALFLIPTDFRVRARGELQPAIKRHLFAPRDGQIMSLSVAHDQAVPQDAELARLRSSELEVEIQRLTGELDTIGKRLDAVASERILVERDTRDAPRRSLLAAEEEQLKIERASYEQQLKILHEQSTALIMRSPLAGHVLTWNIEQLLAGRPVRRGQLLLSVADVEGPWVVELQVPDDQIDHLLAAQQAQQQPLNVSLIVLNEPENAYPGTVSEIAGVVTTTESGDATVQVTVNVDRQHFQDVRPGTTVVAKVQCGRASLGYVWLHELLEATYTWIFF